MKLQFAAVECRVRLLNINFGHNRELMEKCQRLKEYAEFISMIRENLAQGNSMPDAIHLAMEQGLKRGLLTDILSRCGTEVTAMLLEEFDMEEVKACWQKEAAAKATKEATSRTLARDRILFDLLLTQERYEEAKRAAKDPDYQMKLLNEYGI